MARSLRLGECADRAARAVFQANGDLVVYAEDRGPETGVVAVHPAGDWEAGTGHWSRLASGERPHAASTCGRGVCTVRWLLEKMPYRLGGDVKTRMVSSGRHEVSLFSIAGNTELRAPVWKRTFSGRGRSYWPLDDSAMVVGGQEGVVELLDRDGVVWSRTVFPGGRRVLGATLDPRHPDHLLVWCDRKEKAVAVVRRLDGRVARRLDVTPTFLVRRAVSGMPWGWVTADGGIAEGLEGKGGRDGWLKFHAEVAVVVEHLEQLHIAGSLVDSRNVGTVLATMKMGHSSSLEVVAKLPFLAVNDIIWNEAGTWVTGEVGMHDTSPSAVVVRTL